jgi:hypothetical protein
LHLQIVGLLLSDLQITCRCLRSNGGHGKTTGVFCSSVRWRLLKMGKLSLDGTKIKANASKHHA